MISVLYLQYCTGNLYGILLSCDLASENGPSWQTKCDHDFQLRCIITDYLFMVF